MRPEYLTKMDELPDDSESESDMVDEAHSESEEAVTNA